MWYTVCLWKWSFVTSPRTRSLIGGGAWQQSVYHQSSQNWSCTYSNHSRRRKFAVENRHLSARFYNCLNKSCLQELWKLSVFLFRFPWAGQLRLRRDLSCCFEQRNMPKTLARACWAQMWWSWLMSKTVWLCFTALLPFPFQLMQNFMMKTEVSTAANFVTRLLRGTGLLSEEQLQQFRFSLEEALGGKMGHVRYMIFGRNCED